MVLIIFVRLLHEPPTAVPLFTSVKQILNNVFVVMFSKEVQLSPPLVVLRIDFPTANAVLISKKDISYKLFVVPLIC